MGGSSSSHQTTPVDLNGHVLKYVNAPDAQTEIVSQTLWKDEPTLLMLIRRPG